MSESLKYPPPTDGLINACVSAWDGDITEKEAGYLLEIGFWKGKALETEPEQTETIKYYQEMLNHQDSTKSFFTPDELRLLIEHAMHLKAELDRLTAENEKWVKSHPGCSTCNDQHEAEIDRLKNTLINMCFCKRHICEQCGFVKELPDRCENEQLRDKCFEQALKGDQDGKTDQNS